MFYFSSVRVTYRLVALVTAVSLILSALPTTFFVASAQETTEPQETIESAVVEENNDTETESLPSQDTGLAEENEDTQAKSLPAEDAEVAEDDVVKEEVDGEPTTNLVQGYKFPCDYNDDGSMWCAEGGIEGWEITASNGEYSTSTLTNEFGFYSFDLPDGDWTISEESRVGWEQVSVSQNDEPIDGPNCEFSFGEEDESSDSIAVLVTSKLIAAQNTCDFGNYNFGKSKYQLTGSKWNDLDADGVWDKEEPTLSGWTIVATYGDQSTTTTTDENGNYEFWVPEGTWTVSEVAQSGWTQTGAEMNGVSQGEVLTCTFTVPSEIYAGSTSEESIDESYDGTRCDFGNHEDEVIEEEPRRSSSSGTRIDRGPRGQVLGAATQCSQWIGDYMQEGGENDPEQVLRLQVFLNTQGFESPLTGVFDSATTEQVKLFQAQYASEVIQPWFEKGIVPHNRPTGFVYKMTRWKINNMVCSGSEAYPSFDGEDLNTNVVIR